MPAKGFAQLQSVGFRVVEQRCVCAIPIVPCGNWPGESRVGFQLSPASDFPPFRTQDWHAWHALAAVCETLQR